MVRLVNWKSAVSATEKKDSPLPTVETGQNKSDQVDRTPSWNGNDPVANANNNENGIISKWNIYKNLALISLGFMLLFTSYKALANVQSSLNSTDGLGVASLSVTYAALVLSSLFLPSLVIDKLGCKTTIVLSMACYVPYMAANFYSTFYTLIPTALLVGLGAAPLWSAKCAYLSKIGTDYAKLVDITPSAAITRFFGFFFMTYQSSQIFGNLISSFILKPPNDKNSSVISQQQLSICGAEYENEKLPFGTPTNGSDETSDVGEVEKDKIYLLCGLYVGIALSAVLVVAFFVDRLTKQSTSPSGLSLLAATVRQWKDWRQIQLIPLTVFVGMEQAFMTGDFTKVFVTCSLGIHHVGFVMICHGVVDAISSLAFVPVGRKLGRLPLFLLAASTNAALVAVMLLWHPSPEQMYVFYVIAGLWGMSDGLWHTQVNALYGVTFSDHREAAFSNYRLWESVGFILSFGWSNFLFARTKLYILASLLAVGILGYLATETLVRRKEKTQVDQ